MSIAGMVTDHVYNHVCFQKINSKNAFHLHLIDYMAELMKKKKLENFQVRYILLLY